MDSSERTQAEPGGEVRRTHIALSTPGLIVLLLAVLSPWLFLAVSNKAPSSGGSRKAGVRPTGPAERATAGTDTNRMALVQPCRPGPWGRMDTVRINLEPPEEFIPEGWESSQTTTWHFVGMDAAAVSSVFDSAGLPDDLKTKLLDRSLWEATPSGIDIRPPDSILLALPPGARERIYATLSRFKENITQSTPYCFKPDLIEERFANSHLSVDRISLIRSLMYPRGSLLLFSDMFVSLNATPDRDEKMKMIKTISRMRTMILRLHLDADTDVDSLVNYWGKGGRAKDLRPLLESLTRVPGDGEIDIVHLLPRFARLRLYTFPLPAQHVTSANEDCHWSSFNFFNDTPNPDYTQPEIVAQLLERDYFRLPGSPAFGDIVFFLLPSGDVIHSAVYLADDIVFTKNGPASEQPWMLMTIPDLLALYTATRAPDETLQVAYWRRKDF